MRSPRGTVVFASIYPWGSHLRLAAALRRRGYRVEHISASGSTVRDRVRASIEGCVFHRVERSLGTNYNSIQLNAVVRALDAGPVDLQMDDWVAAALTETYEEHPNFPRRTFRTFRESDLYDKFAMTRHAAGSGWALPQVYVGVDELDGQWPKIVKPRLGSGGHGIQTVSNADECRRAVDALGGWSQVVVEQFVEGESVRVAGVAHQGVIAHAISYRTVKAPDDPFGPSIGISVDLIPDVIERAVALLGPMGFTGFFAIESIRTADGVPRFIEMNNRVFGTAAALLTSGVDLVDDYLFAMGERPSPASGDWHPTGLVRVDSIRDFWRFLGLRWAVAEWSLRMLTRLARRLPTSPVHE